MNQKNVLFLFCHET